MSRGRRRQNGGIDFIDETGGVCKEGRLVFSRQVLMSSGVRVDDAGQRHRRVPHQMFEMELAHASGADQGDPHAR